MIKKLLLAGLGALLVIACGFGEKTDVMLECASPSGATIATLYRVSTGERPRDQEMKINVRPISSTFDDAMYSFSFKHGYDAVIRWHSDRQMAVEYPEDSEITYQEQVIFGTSQTFSSSDQIRVNYQEKTSQHGHFLVEQRCFNRF
jgi:hypothetical protein